MRRQIGTDQKARSAQSSPAPVLKLRQLAMGIIFVVALILLPMFMVWKQIYITNISVRESRLTDSLLVLSKQAAMLRLYNERLAATQRIEGIARTALGLEYPTSEQIVVVRESKKGVRETGGGGIFAVLRKTFSRARG